MVSQLRISETQASVSCRESSSAVEFNAKASIKLLMDVYAVPPGDLANWLDIQGEQHWRQDRYLEYRSIESVDPHQGGVC